MTRIKQILLAITPIGAAAFVGGGGTFTSFRDLADWSRHPHAAAAPATKNRTLNRTKKSLAVLMLVGALSYFVLGGTFANFQAETSNNGSSVSSGTLTMNNQLNSATACLSANAASADNINTGCDAAFAVTNVGPGTIDPTQTAKIVVTNSGSIDASKLYLLASQPSGKLQTQLTSGATGVTSIALTTTNPVGFEGSIATSDSIVVSYGGKSQTFTASAPVSGGATSIPISSATIGANTFPAGSTVTDTNSNTTASNTDCYDSKTATGGTVGASAGTALNFNPTAGNPFCGSVLMWIQEISGANSYCWFGKGSSFSTGGEDANGRCVAPISVTTSGISGTITSIPLTGGVTLNGNVKVGDGITVTQGTHTQTFTASTAATFGATSIAVNSTAVGSAFTAGAVVTNTGAMGQLNPNLATDNISAFQIAHHLLSGKIELYPVSGNGTLDTTSGAAELTHFNSGTYTRTFYVGLYLPVPTGSNQNAIQGLASTFGLTWHMDQ
jgi:hypothetical protein